MLRLFLAAGAMELRTVAVVSNTLSIGRRPYNDLQLDDLTVSGEHAVVRVRNGEVSIHDLDSRNGTMVNGQSVSQRDLVDGDIIDIGIYRLRFEAARAGRVSDDTSLQRPPGTRLASQRSAIPRRAAGQQPSVARAQESNTSQAQSAGLPASANQADAARMPASRSLDDKRGADAQASLGAPAPTSGTFGGVPGQEGDLPPPAHLAGLSGVAAGQVQPLDRSINRVAGPVGQVAVVSRRKGGYFITHLEGLTFPQVNGEPIGLTAHRLNDGDLIELAGIMLRFRLDA